MTNKLSKTLYIFIDKKRETVDRFETDQPLNINENGYIYIDMERILIINKERPKIFIFKNINTIVYEYDVSDILQPGDIEKMNPDITKEVDDLIRADKLASILHEEIG